MADVAAPAQTDGDPLAGSAAVAARLGADQKTIEDLVVANRILAHEGILDAYGHVSVRNPRNTNHYLIARSVSPELVTANDIVEYDLDSKPIGNDESPGLIERFIHGEIYKVRPDVKSIVHTHSAAVIPFSVSTVPLRAVFHMASILATRIPVWDSAESGAPDGNAILVRNSALGASLAATLGSAPAALMRGHGDVIAALNVRLAVKNAIYIDANARMQSQAIALGGPIRYLSVDEANALAVAGGDLNRAWDYWKRRALGNQ
jgi:HCOMODA/2-hydroxy-3-carboxy-muconic semialdehyde decarboxylase